MATSILGLDIGGANLKAATPDRRAVSVPFALWKHPEQLPAALAALVAHFPDATELAVTMTGELCDCFETKREGVSAIIKAVRFASAARPIHVWSTDGVFLNSEEAKANHMKVAAANWHALATFAGRFVPHGRAILVDVGSTTTDIIPILDGIPVPEGCTDYDRLFSRELVYTGVRRTPVCALVPWLTAAELFATTHDVYLTLGYFREAPNDCDTADGRPATRVNAHARLARMYCADAAQVPADNIQILAESVRDNQLTRLRDCIGAVEDRLRGMSSSELFVPAQTHTDPLLAECGDDDSLDDVVNEVQFIVAGSGEFLAKQAIGTYAVSLDDRFAPEVSACAPAYAVAVLAAERRP
jgi:probable H4MPT-linked C1 transfer pathway protein